jgi:hypothetical protein
MMVTPIPGEIVRLRIRQAGIPDGTETLVVQTQDSGAVFKPGRVRAIASGISISSLQRRLEALVGKAD